MDHLSDQELVERVRLTDEMAAFNCLVRRHQTKIRGLLRQLLGPGREADADDLAQEAFLRAYRKLGSYRSDAAFTTWLYRLTYRVYLNSLRKRREESREESELTQLSEPAEAGRDKSLIRIDLNEALKGLSEAERAAVLLFYQNGLTHPEVATVLKKPLGTIKTLINRARATLYQTLQISHP
jgi:RNA polymerase sigma-70 factor (ECF subfamily)